MKLSSRKIAAIVIVSGVLLLAMAGAALAAPPWSDAPAAWWLSSYGVSEAEVATVADGFPDGTFRPADPVTRGQFAKMTVSGLDLTTLDPATPTFKDVAKGSTFYIYIEGAYGEALIGGYPVTGGLEFRPANKITRQQTNSILGRYLSQVELEATGVIHGDVTNYGSLALWYSAEGSFWLNKFEDAGKVGVDHKATTAYLIFHDIVKGSNDMLNPLATLNRGQAAAMILRVGDEAVDITTPPAAPTGLVVFPASPGKDATPQISGFAIPSSPIAVYDTIGGVTTKLTETATNAAGIFYADLTTALADGTHSFTAKVKNDAGLVSPASAPVAYVLDTVMPAGVIVLPAVPPGDDEAFVNSAKPAFTATATDDRSGVKTVEFQVAEDKTTLVWQSVSTDTTPETGTTTFAAVWPTTGDLKDGLVSNQYKFRVIITDNAGNVRTVGPIDVTVDTLPPTVEITAPVPGAGTTFYTESNKPTFTADADDPDPATGDGSGLAKVEFFYYEYPTPTSTPPTTFAGFTLLSTDVSPAYGASYPTAGLAGGRYLFAVRATDHAGNVSVLMEDATHYADGVTQEVIIDFEAPVIAIQEPDANELIADDTNFVINWTLTDVTPPDEVQIWFTLDASVETPDWDPVTGVDGTTDNDGVFTWAVPDVTGNYPDAAIKIVAVDEAGPIVGDIPGHTTTQVSGEFAIYDEPVAVTGLTGEDTDDANEGVDGRDFHAAWTLSATPAAYLTSQKVYVLPSGTTLDLVGDDAHTAVQTLNVSATSWTGGLGLVLDSGYPRATLAAGEYRIWVVVTDKAGRTAVTASDPFTVTAEAAD